MTKPIKKVAKETKLPCKHMNPIGWALHDFCVVCGQAKIAAPDSEYSVCGKCGCPVQPMFNFCGRCGEAIDWT